MAINHYEQGIAEALGLDLNYETTEHSEFCRAVAAKLKQRKGQMEEVLKAIDAQGGYNVLETPILLLNYLEFAGEEDGDLKAELRKKLSQPESKIARVNRR
ncbi:MAG: hypothetical protein WC752_02945 [Patescibacteria group bacterium]|jgi:hypothetical protein